MKACFKTISLPSLSLAVFAIIGVVDLVYSDGLSSFQTQAAKDVFPVVVDNGRHPAPPKGGEWKISFLEDLTVGVKEGDENYMFGKRLYFNVDDDGNIYAVDWDRKRIQKYGPDGKYILTIGRFGQGPGEFQNVWMPHFDREGSLYTQDIANHKVVFFDLNGKLIKEVKLPEKTDDILINSRGEYVGYIHEIKEDPKSGAKVISSFGLFDKDFNPIAVIHQTTQTFATLKGRDPGSLAEFLAEMMSKSAFSPEVTLLLGRDDRLYMGYPESYEIRVYSPSGKPERLIRKDQPSQLVTELHKKDYGSLQEREFLLGLPAVYSESIRKKALAMIRYPKYLPAYQKFALLDNGWLAVVVDAVKDGPAKVDFFDENGVYIAEVVASIPVDGLIFRKDKAYAIVETEEGYRFIKRFTWSIHNSAVKK